MPKLPEGHAARNQGPNKERPPAVATTEGLRKESQAAPVPNQNNPDGGGASTPYKDAAPRYYELGWLSPLPTDGKRPLVNGHHGNNPWPTGDDIRKWSMRYADANLAIRPNPDVICLDVDAYDGKLGGKSLAALETRLGKLPATWTSTARGDGVSGIRWFRLAQPAQPGTLRAGLDPGIDIRYAHNSYAVVPPSLHKSGGQYRWFAPDGTESSEPPRPDDLPLLPDAWEQDARRRPKDWLPAEGHAPRFEGGKGHKRGLAILKMEIEQQWPADREKHGWNNALYTSTKKVYGLVAAGWLDDESTRKALVKMAIDSDPSWDRAAIERTVESGRHRGLEEPRDPGPDRQNKRVEDDDKKSVATQLVEIALEHYELAKNPGGEAIAVARTGGRIVIPLRGESGLRTFMASKFYELNGRSPNQTALTDATTVLTGLAQEQKTVEVHLRTGRNFDGSVILDMGDETYRAIRVGPKGWEVVPRSPVLFRRTAAVGAHPEPVRGGDVTKLRSLLNLSEPLLDLLVNWMVTSFLPDIPHPAPWIHGEQGTGKTDAQRMIVTLIDPSPAPSRRVPRDDPEWAVTTAGSWAIGLENLSRVPEWLSDSICRAITGDGDVRRSLYTNGDLVVTSFRRVILMNGIEVGAIRGDLAERLLPLELERIPEERRLKEKDLADQFEAIRGEVLGGLLDLLVQLLAVQQDGGVMLERPPRMADFAECLLALDRIRGTSTLETYLDQQSKQEVDLLENDLVGQAVLALMSGPRRQWLGAPTALLEELRPTGDFVPKEWPRAAPILSGRLRRLMPSLRRQGIEVEFSRTKKGSQVQLRRVTTSGQQEFSAV